MSMGMRLLAMHAGDSKGRMRSVALRGNCVMPQPALARSNVDPFL
jgi:hypothetical protein